MMKKTIQRVFIPLSVAVNGSLLFLLLWWGGDLFRDPLTQLLMRMESSCIAVEQQLLSIGGKEPRPASPFRIPDFREDPKWLRNPDRFLLGAYDDQSGRSLQRIVALENALGFPLGVVQIYTAWGTRADHLFPGKQAQAIRELGAVPMITWEPWLYDFGPAASPAPEGDVNAGGLRAMADGRYDAYIDRWAADARQFGHPFFLRFGHEMNDPFRYPWGPHNNPSVDYIAAWRHVSDRFKQAGAENVIWVWSPHPAYPNYGEYYPGPDYVDWIGLNILNYGTAAPWSRWWSFAQIIDRSYADLSSYSKPLMLTEFGSLADGGDRPEWFRKALLSLPERYPAVKSVVFFHAAADRTVSPQPMDWSFIDDPEVLTVLREGLGKIAAGGK